MDCDLPYPKVMDIIKAVVKKELKTKFIVIFNSVDHGHIPLLRKLKVSGFIHIADSIEDIKQCIKDIANDMYYHSSSFSFSGKKKNPDSYKNLDLLSNTEILILSLISADMDVFRLSNILYIPMPEIEKYQNNITRKLRLNKNKKSLIKWAIKYKIILKVFVYDLLY